VLREVRDAIGRPGVRTRQIPLVTTLRDAERSRVAALAEWSRQRWQVDTSRAPLKTTRPMEVLPGTTVPGVRKALTVCAILDNLVRMVMGQSASLQHRGVERISVLDARRWLGAPSSGSP
jgi:hypothetical protein